MQSQWSCSQISLQWVCGRQRGSVGISKALHPGRMVTSAHVRPLLPGTAAGAALTMEFNGKSTFIPQSAPSGQPQRGCLDSLTVSGFAGDVGRSAGAGGLPVCSGHSQPGAEL